MSNIAELHQYYADIKIGDLSGNQKKQLYKQLSNIHTEDVITLDDHKKFVELVRILRQASMEDMDLVGQKFRDTLKSLLSVGEDGVYINKLRFIYELIQNVDDCEYKDVSDCNLDIQFRYERDPGLIILTYNEVGFTPENVFAITGIAEKSKNISNEKVEIGEKGIGFKSVFGIARKVRIESGMFAFELYADNFTVPIPVYEGFSPVHGTRLTLEMTGNECKGIYRSLVDQYMTQEAMLNQNPILFLNKLTHLKMYFDGFRYIEFDVQRTTPEKHGELLFEANTSISVDMKDHYNGLDREVKNEIKCYRYTLPITYGREECVARYGNDTSFEERRHNLAAVFPILPENMLDYRGVLYSFLPTQVRTTAPLILHVPYKLGGSREYVDSHNNDAWFMFTNRKLMYFFEKVYLDLAEILKKDIIRYIPYKNNYFFKADGGNVNCLCIPEFKGDYICRKKVFYTEDGTFEDVTHIVAFGYDEIVDDPVEVHRLLKDPSKLFVPNHPVEMKRFGCRVIQDVQSRLFAHGLSHPSDLDEILTFLEKHYQFLSYYKLLTNFEPAKFTKDHLPGIAGHGQLWQALINNARKQIVDKRVMPLYHLQGQMTDIESGAYALLMDVIRDADLDYIFVEYLKKIKYRFVVVENKKDFAIAADNGVVLAKGSELGSFAKLARLFDQQGTFAASMEIRQSSEKLNMVDDSMSNQEYLSLLHGVRKSLKDAFGKRMYNSYIKIISDAGTDKKRFLSELLQNADDCKYPDGVRPFFKLKLDEDVLTVQYNESGFTKDNVRAITAIGESTKKLLLAGDNRSIGEKGVGFKSVFGVAESVEIHSNGFDFRLTNKLPTVPEICEPLEIKSGTVMIFKMRQNIRTSFTSDRILQLCICLRNLKQLNIMEHVVTINDDDKRRVITMDGQRYVFERKVYEFDITDQEAIIQRNSNGKSVDPHQRIACYIPGKMRGLEMFLYSGLPVGIKSTVPLIIDAPFELTTSRENILHNPWNNVVRNYLYSAILAIMQEKADGDLDVLRYVGFRSQNNVISWQNFDDDYLNNYNWISALREARFLPVLGKEEKISVSNSRCVLIPEFIARIQELFPITKFFKGTIIDMIGRSQYAPLLEAIGCEKVKGDEILDCLKNTIADFIMDQGFREGLYAYLSNNQGNIIFEGVGHKVLTLPIFPVKTERGTEYISYSPNIFTHNTDISRDDYYILNTAVMSLKTADAILSGYGRINELTQEVFDAKYQKTLTDYIENKQQQHSAKQIAYYVYSEFIHNKRAFYKCKAVLYGLKPQIPFPMADGSYKLGNKFLNSREQWYAGPLIQSLVIDSKYNELARFLGMGEIEHIHYDEIDLEIDDIIDDDIEDLECDFINFYEIIRNLIDDGLISDEQIEKYHLEFGVGGEDDDEDPYEEFPEKPVKDIKRLRKHIRDKWTNNRNPYIERTYIQWKPKYPLTKSEYTLSMYKSIYNEKKCFCQMCRRVFPTRYIERNDIERNPVYAWDQMYLNLCLNCSKDYILLRYNDVIWQQFIDNIMAADIRSEGSIDVPIGTGSITFTATHLAEVQEIFRNEGWGDSAPRRIPTKGSSIEDER